MYQEYSWQQPKKKKKRNKGIILIIIFIVFLLLIGIVSYFLFFNKPIKAEEKEKPIELVEPVNTYTEIIGYGPIDINENNQFLFLENRENNLSYLKYEVLFEGKTIYTSDFIKPGSKQSFSVYSLLPEGNNTLSYYISIYDFSKNLLNNVIVNQEVYVSRGEL